MTTVVYDLFSDFPNNVTIAGSITIGSLTSGRVPFASTGGLLIDDADMTFATDTLTVTKIAATTFTGTITMPAAGTITATTSLALNSPIVTIPTAGVITMGDVSAIRTGSATNDYFKLLGYDLDAEYAEVARVVGGTNHPYFQASLPLRFLPIATASLPATPVEGMQTYDATLDLITYRDSAAWQTLMPHSGGTFSGAVDFGGQSVVNVGAAGNDFGATNTLVGTTFSGTIIGTPDAITATSETVAASLTTVTTEVTTNGDQDLDNVSLANGTVGQIKAFTCVAEGHATDTWKVTPATMNGGTQITFTGAVGEGCIMIYNTTVGWTVVGNNGGTIS